MFASMSNSTKGIKAKGLKAMQYIAFGMDGIEKSFMAEVVGQGWCWALQQVLLCNLSCVYHVKS